MVVSAQHFSEVTNGYQKSSSGLWVHKGKMWVEGELVLNGVPQVTREEVEALARRIEVLETKAG